MDTATKNVLEIREKAIQDHLREIDQLRAALEQCRQHVIRHYNANGGWWNDSTVWRLVRDHIDPALGTVTR